MLNYNFIEHPTKDFCVYLTIYSGNKLPPYYIGSTNCKKLLNGKYHGSVSSKKYKSIWKEELKNNKHLFISHIIYESDTREESLEEEYNQHKFWDVVKNPLFINMSLASKNGFFGMDNSGKINSKETRLKIKESLLRNSSKKDYINPNKGKKQSPTAIENNRKAQLKLYANGYINPQLGKESKLKNRTMPREFGKRISETRRRKILSGEIVFNNTNIHCRNSVRCLDITTQQVQRITKDIFDLHKGIRYHAVSSNYYKAWKQENMF